MAGYSCSDQLPISKQESGFHNHRHREIPNIDMTAFMLRRYYAFDHRCSVVGPYPDLLPHQRKKDWGQTLISD